MKISEDIWSMYMGLFLSQNLQLETHWKHGPTGLELQFSAPVRKDLVMTGGRFWWRHLAKEVLENPSNRWVLVMTVWRLCLHNLNVEVDIYIYSYDIYIYIYIHVIYIYIIYIYIYVISWFYVVYTYCMHIYIYIICTYTGWCDSPCRQEGVPITVTSNLGVVD